MEINKLYSNRQCVIKAKALITLFIVIVFISESCNVNNDDFTDRELNEQLQTSQDTAFNTLIYYYNNCPDSVSIVAQSMETRFIDEDNLTELISLYSFMSEFYQHRRKNPEIALDYLLKALEIAVENPEIKYDKTYLYISIGNILYTYELYDEAIFIYKQISKITDVSKRPSVMFLINNNIALSFRNSNQADSARHYFDNTLQYISQIKNREIVYKAQYYNYLSSLAYYMGNIDSLPLYFKKSNKLLKGLIRVVNKYPVDYAETYFDDVKINYYRNKVNSLDWMGQYYFDKNIMDSAIIYWSEANHFSLISKDITRSVDISLNLSGAYLKKQNLNYAMEYVDSALEILKTEDVNYEQIELAYRNKADVFSLMGNDIEMSIAEDIADRYRDTLLSNDTTNNISLMQIELAVKPVQLEMKEIELGWKEKTQTVERQNLLIKLLIGIILFIVISLIIYYKLFLSLRRTRVRLAESTIEKISPEKIHSGNSKQLKSSVEKELLEKFKSEILVNKVYLEPNINLNQIAERLETNRSYISKIINTVYKMNFSDYINKLRINQACIIISKNKDPKFTIDHLYSKVGFIGKSTFYNAFKKYTGVTPAVFFNMNNQADKD